MNRSVSESIEERLYECFEKIADDYNGELIFPLNQSGIVRELFGEACANELLEVCYQKWLETHEDKYEETSEKAKQAKGYWVLDNGVLLWRNEE